MEVDNRKSKWVRGFTLIELIMTIVLIGIVVIPSSIFMVETVRGALKSQDIIVAVNLARMELEKTNNMAYDDISDASFSPYPGYNYDLNRKVTVIEEKKGKGGKKSVTEIKVTVYPAGKLGSKEDLLATVITHRTSYAE